MNIAEIGRSPALQGLGDDLPQPLGRKRVISQTGQGKPFEAHLSAIPLLPGPDGSEVEALTMKDRLHLMEVPVDAMHRMILADVFADVEQRLGRDPQSQLLKDFPGDGLDERLTVVLAAAGQHEEFTFFRADAYGQQLFTPQDDGPGGGPHARSIIAGSTVRSGHARSVDDNRQREKSIERGGSLSPSASRRSPDCRGRPSRHPAIPGHR